MPLDTSIALQAKAPEFNPLQQALQVAQFRAYNANGLAAQQQLDANNAASQAFKAATDPTTGQTDYNKFRSIMAQGAGAYNLPQINQQITAQQQAQQNLDRGNIALNGDQIDNYKKGLSFMTQQFATLNPNDPDFNAKMLKIGADAVQMGHLDPNMVVSTMSQIPQDPNQRDIWFKQKLNAMQGATEQLSNLKPQVSMQSNGQTINTVTTDPLSGKQSTTPLMNQKLPPETLAQQVTVQGDDGSTSQMTMADMLRKQGLGYLVDGGGAPGQPGQPSAATGTGGNGRYPAGQPATVQTKPAAGVVDANQKVNAAGGDMLAADQQSNAQSGTRVNMLQNASTALANAQTGTGADKLNAVRGVIATLGGPADKVASYDEANKYLTQYAQTKAASFGHGTDSQLAAALAGNGNTKISNLAAQDVVKVNLGLERMEQARMKAWESAGLQPSQYGQWKSQWGSQVDPRVFIADQMDPTKIQGMVKGMNPKEQATFRTQYNWAVQNGFINGPQ
jgi:hypothetical protein